MAELNTFPTVRPQKYDDTLLPFLVLMRRELHSNSSKGDRPGWLTMQPGQCLLEIYWHVAKLSAAVKNEDKARIAEHAAGVANMAMMQADIAGLLDAPQPSADTLQAAGLSAQDADLLEQGAAMLEALAGDERNRGNDSAAMGAECSAHAVRRLAVKLLAAPTALAGTQLAMNDELLEILGRPNFKCAHVAEALRAGGQKIPNRAENEQAAVILFLLNHYLADQVNWWANARAALQAMAKGGAA